MMPRVDDPAAIRGLLLADPAWAVYALGDLSPAMFPKTQWFAPDLTLVLHDYGTAILFAMGPASVREALDHVTWPVHLQVREDALAEVARHATVTSRKPMVRMGRSGGQPPPDAGRGDLVRLGAADVPALERLYTDGEAAGEAPDFFYPSMVTDGVFFGVHDGPELVAVAGTHLVSRDEGAAAIGNVYTRRDRRGRGLGRAVTAAVLGDLAGVGIVGLNVKPDNAAAIRVYESLGFTPHCGFVEAVATGWREPQS